MSAVFSGYIPNTPNSRKSFPLWSPVKGLCYHESEVRFKKWRFAIVMRRKDFQVRHFVLIEYSEQVRFLFEEYGVERKRTSGFRHTWPSYCYSVGIFWTSLEFSSCVHIPDLRV